MKLARLRIENFRSCKTVEIEVASMHAIVGANNAGKSTILHALDFLFNASIRSLNEESFWNKCTTAEIRVEGVFTDLSDAEIAAYSGYLRPDNSFHMARTAKFVEAKIDQETGEQGEARIEISQEYCKPQPKRDWLRDGNITGKNITEWMKNPDALTVNGQSFVEGFGGVKKPSVEQWREAAAGFVNERLQPTDFADAWEKNPKGYAGVLKGNLPCFILVPAVRDLSEEAKVAKTNPFGRLLGAVVASVATKKRFELEAMLKKVASRLNRIGGSKRLKELGLIEKQLNGEISRIFDCDLEIEFETPNFESLVGSPRLYADDGFRGLIELKGHGLQRAVIFSILRNYASLLTGKGDKKHRTLILAFEEPELYMHPLAQRSIRRLFKEIAANDDQVFFTTHSALLVDVADFDEVIRVETESVPEEGEKKALCSKIRQLPISKIVDDEVARHPFLAGKVTATSMRDYYSNAYNRSRNEGFFARKVILVEGATEDYSLPIFALALGIDLDLLGISIIECGGKSAMDRLYRIFNELGIPTFMLFDYDRSNSDKNIVKKSREILTLLGESPDAPDAFTVTSRAAYFKETWEKDIAAEVPDYAALQAEARQALGTTAGKPMIARYIARKLTKAPRGKDKVPLSVRQLLESVTKMTCAPSCLKTRDGASVSPTMHSVSELSDLA